MGNISLKERLVRVLRWSEKYTKTDMVYFASGNFWLITSRVIGVGSGVMLTLTFANLISPTTFGTYKYILAVAGIIGAFSLNGLNPAVIRVVAQGNPEVIRPIFWISFKWSLPASIFSLIGALYYFIQGNNTLGLGLILIALFNPFFNSLIFSKSLLMGLKKFKANALYSIHRSLIPVITLIIILSLTDNLLIILLGYFISNFIAGWITFELSARKFALNPKASDLETKEKVNETVTYGKHLSAVGIFMQVVGYIDQFLLWHFVGPVQLAVYIFALAPVRELRSFAENFFPLIFPKFAVKSKEEIKKTIPLRMWQMLFVSIAIAVLYIAAAPFIFKIFFPQYLSSVFASQLLAIAIVLQPKGLIDILMITHGKVKERYIYTFSNSFARLILMVILIPLYGFMGAVSAIIISELVSAIILLFLYKKM